MELFFKNSNHVSLLHETLAITVKSAFEDGEVVVLVDLPEVVHHRGNVGLCMTFR
jgi:hypothetical protein